MNIRYKYPRTCHLPWSEAITDDDNVMHSTEQFENEWVIVTEKMDGENTTMYSDGIHARSLDSKHHPSRDWIKAFHASIASKIPPNIRICGENVYARHSIHYDNLKSYFYGFSVWEDDVCLSWGETLGWFRRIGITPVPTIYEGIYDERKIKNIWNNISDNKEGYVIRLAKSFILQDISPLDDNGEFWGDSEFSTSVGKFVRKNHVQTNKHWMHQKVVPNKLKQ
jgi:hypothetical protein